MVNRVLSFIFPCVRKKTANTKAKAALCTDHRDNKWWRMVKKNQS